MAKGINIYKNEEFVLPEDLNPDGSRKEGFSLFELGMLSHEAQRQVMNHSGSAFISSASAGNLWNICLKDGIKAIHNYPVHFPKKDSKNNKIVDEKGAIITEEKDIPWDKTAPETQKEEWLSLMSFEHKRKIFRKILEINDLDEKAEKN